MPSGTQTKKRGLAMPLINPPGKCLSLAADAQNASKPRTTAIHPAGGIHEDGPGLPGDDGPTDDGPTLTLVGVGGGRQ